MESDTKNRSQRLGGPLVFPLQPIHHCNRDSQNGPTPLGVKHVEQSEPHGVVTKAKERPKPRNDYLDCDSAAKSGFGTTGDPLLRVGHLHKGILVCMAGKGS